MKEEHGAELEAKILTETKLRNLESQVANDKEKMEKMSRNMKKYEEENKRVREEGEGGGGGREAGGGFCIFIPHSLSNLYSSLFPPPSSTQSWPLSTVLLPVQWMWRRWLNLSPSWRPRPLRWPHSTRLSRPSNRLDLYIM